MATVSRPLRYGVVAVLVLAVIGIGAWVAFMLFGPGYIETSVAPGIARWMGIGQVDLDIRRIGSTGAEIASLKVGEADNPALILGPVLIDYAPSELAGGRIDHISVGGAKLFCGYRDGAFYFRGLDLQALLSRFGKAEAAPSAEEPPPVFPVGSLHIQNGVVVFFYGEKRYRLPFDATLERESSSGRQIQGSLTLYPRGESIALSGRLDLQDRTGRAAVEGKGLDTARFADWIGRYLPDLTLRGGLDIAGEGEVSLDPPSVRSAAATATFRSRETGYGAVSLASSEAGADPLTLSLDWQEHSRIQISLPPIRVGGPLPFEIGRGRASLLWDASGVSVEGDGLLSLDKTPEGAEAPVRVTAPLDLPLSVEVRREAGTDRWQLRAAMEKGEGPSPGVELSAAETSVAVEMDHLQLDGLLGETTATADFRVATGEVTVSSGDVRATFPGLMAEGTANRGADGRVETKGTLTLARGSLRALAGRVRLERTSASLPFRWPPKGEEGKGEIAVGAMVWEGRNLGALEGTLRQVSSGVTVSAEHWNLLLSGMGVWIEGDVPLFSAKQRASRIDISASWPESSPDLDLGRFVPSAKGFRLNGDLSAEGHFRFGGAAGPGGALAVDFKKGVLEKGKQEIALTGIAAGLRLPYLPDIRSAPAQELRIEKAAFGQVAISDAAVVFQVEPGGAVLIEKAGCRWAGGEVSSQAIRISPGEPVYEFVLHCDRLSLASVLEQFGAVRAGGEGTVNGQIPIRMAEGDLTFDDGFLYSTPGDGGTIHVTGAELLTAGIPKDSMQFNQIDLAREALKDYHYDWARLRLNTEGEDLIMSLHLNGKPVNPLPFVYKKEVGGFVRISEDQVGSRFQGIRLDVNFRLPLNKILEYRDLLGLIGSSL
jgi:hypothetical protein